MVQVKLYGILRRYRPAAAPGKVHEMFPIEINEGAMVIDLAQELGIDSSSFSAIAVNGESTGEHTVLRDGDDVRLFPPSAGG